MGGPSTFYTGSGSVPGRVMYMRGDLRALRIGFVGRYHVFCLVGLAADVFAGEISARRNLVLLPGGAGRRLIFNASGFREAKPSFLSGREDRRRFSEQSFPTQTQSCLAGPTAEVF